MQLNEVITAEDVENTWHGSWMVEKYAHFLFDLYKAAGYKQKKVVEGKDIYCHPDIVSIMATMGTLKLNDLEGFPGNYAGTFRLFNAKHKVFIETDNKGIRFE